MKLFHGSQTANIKVLQPSISNHKRAFVYFSQKRENTVVYLFNAVERYCKETNFRFDGKFYTWASYGFDKDGILRLEEYYPNATEETYSGVSGYIYTADVASAAPQQDIPFAYVSEKPVKVNSCEFVRDAYREILRLEQIGKIRILRYESLSDEMKARLRKTLTQEFERKDITSDYKHFLQGKFDFLNHD